jgi:uncharacterized repeat protein (TIGR01451 family)
MEKDMKKFVSNLLRRMPKRWMPMAVAVAAVAIPAVVMAWGPDRPTYTMDKPADHVTFDSITDNPEVGDERNILTIKDASNTASGGWQDAATAQAGHEYLIRVYVHNDAAANLGLKATNVRTKVNVPTTTGKSVQLGGFITADNATPGEIWDSATLTSSSDFNVAYVAGSARYYNNVFGANGTALSDTIVTDTGAQLGYDKLDGVIPGCLQYAGYVTFKVKVQGPQTDTFTMSKQVSKHGENKWVDSYAAQPGETVDYLIQYKNTGSTQQDNVVVKDTLPAGMTYVAGSTVLGNSKTPTGAKISDNLTTTSGVNIGSYAAGANGWIIYSAKVAANDSLPTCGDNKLTNNATVETDSGNKSDSADVTTTKKCEETKTPKYECSGLSVDKISRTQFKFTATKTVENATFKKFTFVVRDAKGNQIATQDSTDGTYTYSQDKVGTYTVQATVVVTVNGQDKTATSDACKKSFEVTEQPVTNTYTCDTLQLVKKSRDTFEFTAKASMQGNVKVKEYSFDFGDGQSIIVGAGQETQTHTYAKAGDYTARLKVTFEVDGKTVTGITSDACAQKVTVEQPPVEECKPGIPAGDSRCTETPASPGELPNTSAGVVAGGLFGSSALGLSLKAWAGSRRNLRSVFKR